MFFTAPFVIYTVYYFFDFASPVEPKSKKPSNTPSKISPSDIIKRTTNAITRNIPKLPKESI